MKIHNYQQVFFGELGYWWWLDPFPNVETWWWSRWSPKASRWGSKKAKSMETTESETRVEDEMLGIDFLKWGIYMYIYIYPKYGVVYVNVHLYQHEIWNTYHLLLRTQKLTCLWGKFGKPLNLLDPIFRQIHIVTSRLTICVGDRFGFQFWALVVDAGGSKQNDFSYTLVWLVVWNIFYFPIYWE